MVSKLITFAISILLSSTAFSQIGTPTKTIVYDSCHVVLSCDVARQVATDLVRYDSVRAELPLVWDLLTMTEDKTRVQAAIIESYRIKESNYEMQINLYQKKEETYNIMVKGLEKDVKRAKTKTKILTGAVGILGTYFIVSLIGN